MVNASVPFYLNWTFWSFVVAFTALLVSLVPKIILLTKGKKIDLEIHNRVTVNHWVGYPSLLLFFGIFNKGHSKIRINSIDVKISREGSEIKELKCSGFFETTSSQFMNLFTPFSLASEDSWSHTCFFGTENERITEQKIKAAISNIDKDLSEKSKINTNMYPLVEAENELVEPLIEIQKEKFIWEQGEYLLTITINTEPSLNISKKVRFTLYETDSKELVDYSDDYKYGINYFNQKNKGLVIPLKLEL